MLEKVKFEGAHSKAVFAKNLFLQDKKKKEEGYLVIAAHDTAIDMKGLTKHLKVGSGNLRGGEVEVMQAMLGAKKGAVNLFAILNDTAKKVHLIMDQRLMNDFELIAYHPMQNDATTAISNADMKKVIAISGREAEVIDFTKLVVTDGAAAEEKKAGGAPQQKAAKHEKKEEIKQDVH
jgi:Ala-tRNA(Pro) deacylase